MPIRTSRGRSAAYRSLWQWPLRSPLRLAITAAAVLVLTVGISLAAAALRPADDSTPTSSGMAVPGTASRSPGPGTAATPKVLPPVAPLTPTALPLDHAPAPALQTAASWAAAWVDHPEGTTSQQWLARLRPFTTDEYLGVLSGVDPDNVPATRVTGPPAPVRVAPSSVQVNVPTDALTLVVLVVDTGSGWRVAGYDRA
ncbi:hypothetical protein [Pseudonocardia asaccharolytica]|uniref:Uncharacterized protein n=1 Tax=Pseudonocardia asaccharolytica DSM 44247 = NBRC 16224 TaxID=1123024 RepID=A0A511D5B6_9PSEU|nr:hypothetical protein [Pseudonocardia asaccharolytica]GEL19996.1 hypothetical protein PA7_38330 [Pseudonocardia asaccharolytica DSM 44247 = NBRC 16224]